METGYLAILEPEHMHELRVHLRAGGLVNPAIAPQRDHRVAPVDDLLRYSRKAIPFASQPREKTREHSIDANIRAFVRIDEVLGFIPHGSRIEGRAGLYRSLANTLANSTCRDGGPGL